MIFKKMKTIYISIFLIFSMFAVPPLAHAGWKDILLYGALGFAEYKYLENTLKDYHYNKSDQLMSSYKKEYGVSEDEKANAMLDDIMGRLLEEVAMNEEVDPPYSWFVNEQKSFNAFCAIGHNVSVNIGLFEYVNYNEDEIAFVLAHEIVHGQKNHSMKSLKKVVGYSTVAALYNAKNPNVASYIFATIVNRNMVANYATLPQEKEADKESYDYAVNAGFNPGAPAAIWARVCEKEGDNSRSAFEGLLNPNDHPTNVQRVTAFSERLKEYSGNMVEVKDSNVIYIKDKPFLEVQPTENLYGRERAYLIAGSIVKAIKDNEKNGVNIGDLNAYVEDDTIKIGNEIILVPAEGERSAEDIKETLNELFKL